MGHLISLEMMCQNVELFWNLWFSTWNRDVTTIIPSGMLSICLCRISDLCLFPLCRVLEHICFGLMMNESLMPLEQEALLI